MPQTAATQLVLDVPTPDPAPDPPATYWENRGPRDWQPVTVVIRYGNTSGLKQPVLPHVTTGKLGPRNVLIQRANGSCDVVPVRNLRRRKPA